MKKKTALIMGGRSCSAQEIAKHKNKLCDMNLSAWIKQQKYSLWYKYDLPDFEETPENGMRIYTGFPEFISHKERDLGRRQRVVPRHNDGYTIGNTKIFAAIGILDDMTEINRICGDDKTVEPVNSFYNDVLNKGSIIFTLEYEIDGKKYVKPLRYFFRQTAKRVIKTSIICVELSEPDVDVNIVFFTPSSPEKNMLSCLFSVKGNGNYTVRNAVLKAFLRRTSGKNNRIEMQGKHSVIACLNGEFLGVSSEGCIGVSAMVLSIAAGNIGPGAEKLLPVHFIPAKTREKCMEYIDEATVSAGSELEQLEKTKSWWECYVDEVPVKCSDTRLNDYLDSALCMIKCHESPKVLHLGSTLYTSLGCFAQDNYFIARAFQKFGRLSEPLKNFRFFYEMWRTVGMAAAYEINNPARRHPGAMNDKIGTPAYFLMMLRDLYEQGGVQEGPYFNMIEDAVMDYPLTKKDTLPMQGDEGWLWPADANELDELLDALLLAHMMAGYACEAAARAGNAKVKKEAKALMERLERSIEKNFKDRETGRYAISIDADGRKDKSLVFEPLSHVITFGYRGTDDPFAWKGVMDCWTHQRFSEGLRSDMRTSIITGNTQAYFLGLCGRMNLPCTDDFLKRIMKLSAATGCVWEGMDIYDDRWSGEKRRAWDTSNVIGSLLDVLFGITFKGGVVTINPHLPEGNDSISIDNFPVKDDRFGVFLSKKEFSVAKNGRTIYRSDKPSRLVISGGKVAAFPQAPVFPPCKPLPGGNISALVCDKEYGLKAMTEPDEEFLVCGFSFRKGGFPSGSVELSYEGKRKSVKTNRFGWFKCSLSFSGFGLNAVEISAGSNKKTLKIKTGWDFTKHLEDFLCSPLTIIPGNFKRHSELVAMEIMKHRTLRCVNSTDGKGVSGNRIGFSGKLPPGADYTGKNYAVYSKADGINVVIKAGSDVFSDAEAFIFDLRANSKVIRPFPANTFLFRWEQAFRFGADTNDKLPVKVRTDKSVTFMINGKAIKGRSFSGLLDLSMKRDNSVKPKGLPYIAVTPIKSVNLPEQSIKGAMFELEVEGDSNFPVNAKVEIELPINFIVSEARFGQQWERIAERIKLHKHKDGKQVLSFHCIPGRPFSNGVYKDSYPPSKRNMRLGIIKLRL